MKLLRHRGPEKTNRNVPRRYPEEKDNLTRGLCPLTQEFIAFWATRFVMNKGRMNSTLPQPSSHLGRRSGRSPAEPCPPPR